MLGFGVANTSQAFERGWYGGLGLGASSMNITSADWDDGSLSAGSADDADFGAKAYAGFRFNKHVWLDISYLLLGNTTFEGQSSGPLPALWATGPVRGDTSAEGMSVAVVGAWPLRDRVAPLIKAGLFMWDTTVIRDPTISGRQRVNNDGIDLIYGLGVEVSVFRNWNMRAEWERTSVDMANAGGFDIDFISLSVIYEFK